MAKLTASCHIFRLWYDQDEAEGICLGFNCYLHNAEKSKPSEKLPAPIQIFLEQWGGMYLLLLTHNFNRSQKKMACKHVRGQTVIRGTQQSRIRVNQTNLKWRANWKK
jgi:hypothetical protein